jgi:hypothetical protein
MDTKIGDDELLKISLESLTESVPGKATWTDWSVFHARLVSLGGERTDASTLTDLRRLRHECLAALPRARRSLVIERYVATAVQRQSWELLDQEFDLKHRSWCVDLEMVYRCEAALGQVTLRSGRHDLALRHYLTALVMSPRDGEGLRDRATSLLMSAGWDASALNLARAYMNAL